MNEVQTNRPRILFFTFLLLLSGFAAISYEILYARLLGNLIGNQWAVSASILLTFLLGIGVGAFYAHRLWPYLWLIEAGIGIYAAFFALGSGLIEEWLYIGMPVFGRALAGNVFQCVFLLSVPAFLIGCSLPLFAGYLGRLRSGLVFARVYAIHSFGAALTVVVTEFWLLRIIGLQATVLSIAALNGVVSFFLFTHFSRIRTLVPEASHYVHIPKFHLTALVLASIASAVFQLWMIKIAEFLLGPFHETFAMVLGLILLGIALGTFLTRRFRFNFGHVLAVNLLGLVWLVGGFQITAGLYAKYYSTFVDSYVYLLFLKLSVLAVLMLVPSISFGATIPALITAEDNVARESGKLLFVSSLANAGGFLLMVFYLHQYFDYGIIIVLVACLSGLALLVYWRLHKASIAFVAFMVMGILWTYQGLWNENLLYAGYTAFQSKEKLETEMDFLKFPEAFKDRQDVFSLNWQDDGSAFFFINGYISINLNKPSEKIVGAFSSLFAPRTDRALVLGTGSGATASAVAVLFDHTDTVEINPIVIENLHRMKEFNDDIENMSNVNIILDDAMHYTKASQDKYSLIINTVTSPLYFSSSKLYTQDFLDQVKQRLTDDGVYVTWVDSRVGNKGMDIMLKTLSQTFNSCWLGYIQSKYYLLFCSPDNVALHHPRLAADNNLLRDYLFTKHRVVPEWLPYQIVSTNALKLIKDHNVPLNTLDYPALEFEIARLSKRGTEEFRQMLVDKMDISEVEDVLKPVMDWNPMILGLHAGLILQKSEITIQWLKMLRDQFPDHEQQYHETWLEYQQYGK